MGIKDNPKETTFLVVRPWLRLQTGLGVVQIFASCWMTTRVAFRARVAVAKPRAGTTDPADDRQARPLQKSNANITLGQF